MAAVIRVRNADGTIVEIPALKGDPGDKDAVLYTEQSLSEAQKSQARDNIDAISNADAEKKFGIQYVNPEYGVTSFNDFTTVGRYFVGDSILDGPPSNNLGIGFWLEVLPSGATGLDVVLQKVYVNEGEIWYRVLDRGHSSKGWQRVYDTTSLAELQPKLELIETITVDVENIGTIVRDGFMLDAVSLVVNCPTSSTTGKLQPRFHYPTATGGNWSTMANITVSNATIEYQTNIEFYKRHGWWRFEWCSYHSFYTASICTQPGYEYVHFDTTFPYVNKITLITTDLPVGTTIKIYGVRRNEN